MKIKLNGKSKTVLLKVHDNDEWCQWCDYAVVELTQEFVDVARKQLEILLKMKEENSSVYKIETFDYSCDFISSEEHDTRTSSEILDQLYDTGIDTAGVMGIDGYDDKAEGLVLLRTDCDTMEITDYGVRFTAYVKHTNQLIDTEKITFERMDALFPQQK